jgi:Lactonase, 7-bladed beta-propeller
VINVAGDRVATGLQQSNAVAVLERDPATGAVGKLLGNVTLEGQVSSVVWDE